MDRISRKIAKDILDVIGCYKRHTKLNVSKITLNVAFDLAGRAYGRTCGITHCLKFSSDERVDEATRYTPYRFFTRNGTIRVARNLEKHFQKLYGERVEVEVVESS